MNINQILDAPEDAQMNAKAVGKLRVWQSRNKCKANTIAKLCSQLENDLGRDLSLINQKEISAKLRAREIQNVSENVQEIDFASPSAFPLLYKFKKKDQDDIVHLGQDIADQHKIDKKDPTKVYLIEDMKRNMRKYKKKQGALQFNLTVLKEKALMEKLNDKRENLKQKQ